MIGETVYKRVALLVLMAFATPVLADANVTAVIDGVEAAYADVSSLKADFVQVTRSAAMGDETKQKG